VKDSEVSQKEEQKLLYRMCTNLAVYFNERDLHAGSEVHYFMMDLSIKAKRRLALESPLDYAEYLGLLEQGTPELCPERTQIALGDAWVNLGPSGVYGVLHRTAEKKEAKAARIAAAEAPEALEHDTQNNPASSAIDFFGEQLSKETPVEIPAVAAEPTEEDQADWMLAVGQDFQSVSSTDDVVPPDDAALRAYMNMED
jgi:hypothetical protein